MKELRVLNNKRNKIKTATAIKCESQTDKQKQTNRQTDRPTVRPSDKQTDTTDKWQHREDKHVNKTDWKGKTHN